MKLSLKTSLITTLLMTVSLSSISFIGYQKAKTFMYQSFETQAYTQLDDIKTNIDIWVSGKQEIQNSLAETDALKRKDVAQAAELSVRLAKRNNNPDAFGFMSAEGILYLPGLQVPVTQYDHFKLGIAGKTATIDPVASVSPSVKGTPIVLSSAPVYGYNGSIVGVSSGGNPIQDLIDIISKFKLGKTGHALVFTKTGTVVVGEKKADTLKKNISDMKNKELTAILKDGVNGKSGIKEVSIKGEKNMVIYGKANKMDWVVMIVIPVQEAYAEAHVLLQFFTIVTFFFIVLSGAIIFFLLNKMMEPISVIKEKMEEISMNQGDLTARLPVSSNDEIGNLSKSFNFMLENMQFLIQDILQKSELVTSSSGTLLDNIEQIAFTSNSITLDIQKATDLSSQQSLEYENSSRSMNEINTNLEAITNVSAVISDEVKKTSQDANIGSKNVDELVAQMNLIQNTMNDSAVTVEKLARYSKEIENMVGMISQISAKTELLALNARIEAAHSAEQGKGFSVIANEVRVLAEHSIASTKQISPIITEIKKDTLEAIKNMESVMHEIQIGKQKTEEFGVLFTNIVESIGTVTNQVFLNSSAAEELLQSALNVENGVKTNATFAKESMNSYSNIVSSSEEQLSTLMDIREAVKSLTDTSNELRQMLHRFRV